MRLTIDASVFVAALRPSELHNTKSQSLFQSLEVNPAEVICPRLVLAETAATLARTTSSDALGIAALEFVYATPRIALLDLDNGRADRAARIAVMQRLRGADAVYVQIAEEHETILITWDQEMLARAASLVTVQTPEDYLAGLSPTI